MREFQTRVRKWVRECFGDKVANDKAERSHRFLEEALELFQAMKGTQEEATLLVAYVFGRPVGEPTQEVGGVSVTLAALCSAAGIDLEANAWAELQRVEQPAIIEKIRAKQATKPASSPLPGAVS